MERKIFVIVNPAASNGKTLRHWPQIRNCMQEKGLCFDFSLTKGPEDATLITREALRNGYNIILSVGGDGTLNEVVNGFFEVDEKTRKASALGVISMGTGGDFVRTMGIPKNINRAIERILKGQTRLIDAGMVKYINHQGQRSVRYFCNITDIGLGGDTAGRVNRTSKALGGLLSFLYGAIVSIVLFKNKEISAVIDDTITRKGRVTTFVVANGKYFAGGMKIAPFAEPDDALFDIIILHDLSKLKLMTNIHKVYNGKHLAIKNVEFLRGKKVAITSSEEVLLELDGEQPGKTPVEIEILPGALHFIV